MKHFHLSKARWWLISLFALLALIAAFEPGALLLLHWKTSGWVQGVLGLDYYAAGWVSWLLTCALVALIYWTLFNRFPSGLRLRIMTGVILWTGAMSLLAWIVGRDVYFDQTSGKPLRFYAETPEGIRTSVSPGKDPKYGVLREPLTSEVALKIATKKNRGAANTIPFDSGISLEATSMAPKPGSWTWYWPFDSSVSVPLSVKPLSIEQHRSFLGGEKGILRTTVTNEGNYTLEKKSLTIWYSNENAGTTITWSGMLPALKAHEIQTLDMECDIRHGAEIFQRPLGRLQLSLDGQSSDAQVDLRPLDEKGLCAVNGERKFVQDKSTPPKKVSAPDSSAKIALRLTADSSAQAAVPAKAQRLISYGARPGSPANAETNSSTPKSAPSERLNERAGKMDDAPAAPTMRMLPITAPSASVDDAADLTPPTAQEPTHSGTVRSPAPPRITSASSTLNFRVEPLQLCAGIVDFELPVHAALFGIGFVRPDRNLGLQQR